MNVINAIIVGLGLICGTVLIALGNNVNDFGSFIVLIVAGITANEANKARKASQEAMHNTNGNMTELLRNNERFAAELEALRSQLEMSEIDDSTAHD